MEYPKNIELEIADLKFEVKPYLTISEMEMIVQNVLAIESLAQRKMIKEMLILKSCTNIDLEKYEYDLLLVNGVIDGVLQIIYNIETLENLLKEENTMIRVLEKFLTSVNDKLPKDVNKSVKAWIKELSKLKKDK